FLERLPDQLFGVPQRFDRVEKITLQVGLMSTGAGRFVGSVRWRRPGMGTRRTTTWGAFAIGQSSSFLD
ncbi:MAG TPA: hypothetical protein DD670_08175, partial [Planctomycetaceae bacterium]|nr:hypothetical protein [Planctomycetaceae bacterium]